MKTNIEFCRKTLENKVFSAIMKLSKELQKQLLRKYFEKYGKEQV